MLKVNNFVMETNKLVTIVLLYCVCIAYCYPSRPQNSHDEFLVKKSEEKLHAIDCEDDAKEKLSTPGPYQINIPLKINGENNEGKTDIATITLLKKKNERYSIDENMQEIILNDLPAYYYYPSKPLNERPVELTWLDWLVEDAQSQNLNEDQINPDELLRRRITPKHIFDVATFRPTCATGYNLDHTGKCTKIIILNDDAIAKFWSDQLKDKIGAIDYPDDAASDNEQNRNRVHIDVIMPLMNTFLGEEVTSFEISDSKGHEKTQGIFLKRLAQTTTENYNPTTVAVTLFDNEKTSTVTADLSSVTTTETISFTATDNNKDSTAVLKDSTFSNEELPTTTFVSYREMTTLAPEVQVTQIESSSSNLIPFPDQPKKPGSVVSAFVHSPDRLVSFQAVPSSEEQTTRTRDIGSNINEFDFPKFLYNGEQRRIVRARRRRKYNRRIPDRRNMFIFPSEKSAQL